MKTTTFILLLVHSNPSYLYGITLNELHEEVHKYQGREPSGRQFGEIVLDANSKFSHFLRHGLGFNYNWRALEKLVQCYSSGHFFTSFCAGMDEGGTER